MAGAAACSQDFFISHSWSDDATLKYAKLQQVADEFEAENGRPPTFWLDKVCIDQSAIGDALRDPGKFDPRKVETQSIDFDDPREWKK